MSHLIVPEPAPPLNRFEGFPFAAIAFPADELTRTDGFEPVRVSADPVDAALRFEPSAPPSPKI